VGRRLQSSAADGGSVVRTPRLRKCGLICLIHALRVRCGVGSGRNLVFHVLAMSLRMECAGRRAPLGMWHRLRRFPLQHV
jgi:hypothetical protein